MEEPTIITNTEDDVITDQRAHLIKYLGLFTSD